MSYAPLVAPFASFLTVTLLILSLFKPRNTDVQDKLKPYAYRAAQDPDNLDRSFSERVVFPLLERLGRLAGSAAPKQMQERLSGDLQTAGNPVSVNVYVAVRSAAIVGLPLLYLLFVGGVQHTFGARQLVVAGVLFCVGVYLPKRWLADKIKTRQKAIERALPDALDLIVVSMEAGLALDGAIAKVAEKTRGPFKEELHKTLQEIALGKPRRDALRQLGLRTGVKDLIALINSIVQADQMGVSMAQVMRTQADEARLKRRQRAEEKAHQAAVKMLFPLVLFILPSVMVVTVGPAALAIFHSLSGGLLG